MTARLTPTEAVLACAAAESTLELHEARMALIESGGAMMADLDTTGLLAGDGTAGRTLLGGTGSSWRDTCAARSHRIGEHLRAELNRKGAAEAFTALKSDEGRARIDYQLVFGLLLVGLTVAWLFGWPV